MQEVRKNLAAFRKEIKQWISYVDHNEDREQTMQQYWTAAWDQVQLAKALGTSGLEFLDEERLLTNIQNIANEVQLGGEEFWP